MAKKKEAHNFAGSSYDNESVMTINDLHCVFNMPKALKSNLVEGKEVSQGLPPYGVRKAFKVDEYTCPTNWMHGSNLASSYFVPIETEHGMWLDFNRNWGHKHHVAILISVQGVNPLDGQSMVEGALNLRQYKTKCPVHDIEFGADRHCEKCGYKWVPQNYLATTGTPNGLLWLDGFLAEDGVVRQYYFTEEEVKGVAHQIIGAEKKVYSIGIAFYLSKEPKPVSPVVTRGGVEPWYAPEGYGLLKSPYPDNYYNPSYATGGLEALNMCDAGGAASASWSAKGSKELKMAVSNRNNGKRMLSRSRGISGQSVGGTTPDCVPDDLIGTDREFDAEMEDAGGEMMKQLDIAAGAKIDQKVYLDPNDLDFWQEKPAGMLYINYCPSEQAIAIITKGKKDLTKGGEGFLAGLNAGR